MQVVKDFGKYSTTCGQYPYDPYLYYPYPYYYPYPVYSPPVVVEEPPVVYQPPAVQRE